MPLKQKEHKKYPEDETNKNSGRSVNKILCRNGPACEYRKQNRCYYSHKYDEQCRNGSTCKYLEKDICCFRHDVSTYKKKQIVNRCRNGKNCEYLRRGNCNFDHGKDLKNESNQGIRDNQIKRKGDPPTGEETDDESKKTEQEKQNERKYKDDQRNFLEQRNRKEERKKRVEEGATPWSNYF